MKFEPGSKRYRITYSPPNWYLVEYTIDSAFEESDDTYYNISFVNYVGHDVFEPTKPSNCVLSFSFLMSYTYNTVRACTYPAIRQEDSKLSAAIDRFVEKPATYSVAAEDIIHIDAMIKNYESLADMVNRLHKIYT